jgi:hypothetical protein
VPELVSASVRAVLAAVVGVELALGLGFAVLHDPPERGVDDAVNASTTTTTFNDLTTTLPPIEPEPTTVASHASLAVYGDPDANAKDLGPAGPDRRGHSWTRVAGGSLPDQERWQVNARRQGTKTCLSVVSSGSTYEGCYGPDVDAGAGSAGDSMYQSAVGVAPTSAATVVLTTRDGRRGNLKTKASPVGDVRIFWGFFDCDADLASVEGFDRVGNSVGRFDYPPPTAGFEPVCRVPSGS